MGDGLPEAVAGVDVIIHAATSFSKVKQVDIEGTRRLLALSIEHAVKHFIYISIIGVDRMPNSYLQAKYKAEQLVQASGVPYTVMRAAQFYGGFIDTVLQAMTKPPVGLIPKGFLYQPMDIGDAAEYVVELIKAGPSGEVVNIAGPCTYELVDLARTWLRAQGKRKPLLQIPIPGKFAAAMRAGYATAPEQARNGLNWETWLQREYDTDGTQSALQAAMAGERKQNHPA
jgi:uncharacterized protein YbjT (DUF2867 family)